MDTLQNDFLTGVKALNVPRMEDLPYISSPPVQFVYQSTALLNLGSYIWADIPAPLVVNRPILNNALYYFRSITLAADTEDLDFSANIIETPGFNMYRVSDASTPLLREAVLMPCFLQQMEYRLCWMSKRGEDSLLGSFRGSLIQGPGLLGKASITLKAIVTAQEVVDKEFLALFVNHSYPKSGVTQ
jgi:hypothetical protein